MQETADVIFHLEPPAAPGFLPTGPLVLQGWVHGKPGRHIVDLRARYGGRIFPAVFGLPRTDLARYFNHHRPQLMAGFDLGLVLPPGGTPVELEALDLGGTWLSLGTHPVAAAKDPGPGAAPAGMMRPYDFSQALRLLLRQAGPGADLPALAAALAAELPVPPVTRFPHQPFHGHLHHPALVMLNRFGRLTVEGWLFHETQPIKRVLGSFDLLGWQTIAHGAEMDHVAARYPQFATALASGVNGHVDAPAQLPSPLSLRIYAELADGTWSLCHLQRTRPYDGEQDKVPFAPCNLRSFWGATRALQAAVRQRGFILNSGGPLRAELWKLAREYWARAPRPRAADAAGPENTPPAAPPPARVTLVTHNLNREGAPLFLLEFAGQLAAGGTQLTVISAADGPLRVDFERLPAKVQIVDVQPLLAAPSAGALRRALAELARAVDLRDADLVVANTLSAFWGVHLARRAGRPSLFYIHESTTPDSFYHGHLAPGALPVVEETFAQATMVSFLTDATRRYYQRVLTRSNHGLNPGWIDLARLDRFRAEHPRTALRARLGLDPATRLVINVGTVCERKGQHIFLRAVEQLWREQPALAAACRFLVVGARHTSFDAAVEDLRQNLGRPNIEIIPETGEPGEYFGAADLFVCSSYEESFPRVVLEAMAFAGPILATAVHGVPEMVRPGEEAELVPPGDSHALARGLARLLQDPAHAARLAAQARARVALLYDSSRLLPHHAALAAAVARLPS